MVDMCGNYRGGRKPSKIAVNEDNSEPIPLEIEAEKFSDGKNIWIAGYIFREPAKLRRIANWLNRAADWMEVRP